MTSSTSVSGVGSRRHDLFHVCSTLFCLSGLNIFHFVDLWVGELQAVLQDVAFLFSWAIFLTTFIKNFPFSLKIVDGLLSLVNEYLRARKAFWL